MRPLRSFILLLIFLACFTGLHYIIKLNQFFPSINEFIPAGVINSITSVRGSGIENKFAPDTLDVISPAPIKASLPVPENPAENHLKNFIDSLDYSKGQVRIMYYGDSQIEGDRITSWLRTTLRKGRGGTGPGLLLPLMPVMYTRSVWVRSSSNWKKYNYLSYKSGEITSKILGPFMAICRFLPEGVVSEEPQKAFIRMRPSKFADSSCSEYETLRIFYSNPGGVVWIKVKGDGIELKHDTLTQRAGLNEFRSTLDRHKDIIIEFEGRMSPDIFGISIESKEGIIVDNIPQRGSAGLEFTMVDRKNLKESFAKLSPDLIILHYGLNIVKNIRGDYSYYRRGLMRQISLLKELTPRIPVLVVGVTDMAENEGDSVRSFANIPAIIEAQRQATLKSDADFWDSYEAMGGKSSVIRWSQMKPPLVQKDLVHFTYPGADSLSAKLVSSMFIRKNADTLQVQSRIAIAPRIIIEKTVSVSKPGFTKSIVTSVLAYNPEQPFIFTTAAFWIFFLIVLLGYSIIYRKITIRNIYLFLVSLFFYYKAGGFFLFILIFVTIVDYTCGRLIFISGKLWTRRTFLLMSIISNLALLGYFKYASFITMTLNSLFGTTFRAYDLLGSLSNSFLGTSFDISSILLPVGISFFTFQSLSYTIDVYRKKMEPVRSIIDFGFYVSFFPHLVAGPIVRASVFMPQIYQEYHLSKHEFSHAMFMISKGLIKKIVISNFIALNLVDRVFDAPSLYSGFENLLAIYGYGLQIYCDFSGYTDIAIGVALILGFRLPVNFNAPYKASSIADFWKRWHISLSQWLRDYLYISLGGNRKGKIRTLLNLMITMLLGGLWHGASIRFIIWGGLHGIGLVINRIWNSITGFRLPRSRIARILGIFITFQFVNFCWIFFRAPDMESIKIMFRQIFGNFSPGSYLTVIPGYSNALLLMAVAFVIHFLPEKTKEAYRGLFIKMPMAAQMVVMMLVAMLLYQMRTTEVMPFIYFRF